LLGGKGGVVPSETIDEATRREWRELGFFYDLDDEARAWRLVGSKAGLARFAAAIATFASDPRNSGPSEHEHLGPYMYLELGSWPKPEITDHWIAGPLAELHELSARISASLKVAKENEVLSFRDLYAPGSPYDLLLEVRSDEFDPAKEDPHCW
jgi:hypothetical protein